jgi:exopolysaccharide biosynthesis polyprenyl glycosylphosphotransferase
VNQLTKLMQGKHRLSFPVWLVMLVDVALVNAGFALAFLVRFGRRVHEENLEAFLGLLPFILVLTLVVFAGIGLYTVKRHAYSHVARLIVIGVAMTFMMTMAMAFWQRQFAFPRSVFVVAPLFQIAALTLWRNLTLRLERRWHGKKKLLIVGNDEDTKRLLPKVLSLPTGWVDLACIHPPGAMSEIISSLSVVDTVLLTEKVDHDAKREIIIRCFELGREVFVIPDLYDVLLKKSLSNKIGDTPIMEVPEILVPPVPVFLKHTFDFIFALTGLVFSLPVFLLIAVIIRITSPGPVFYTQERVGKSGKGFRVIKFRSMLHNAELLCGPVLAAESDPRITPVGRVLRTTRLDELPQLLNVIRGEMSLVGPRPERPEFVRKFVAEIPEYRYRYLVRPGLTGLAQVRSRYSTTVHDKLRYDLSYLVNYSLLMDLKIILETIPTVFSSDAAQGCGEAPEVDDLFIRLSNSKAKTGSIS